MRVSTRSKHALDLPHDARRVTNMLQDRIALHSLKQVRRKGQQLRISRDIDSGHRKQIQVDVSINSPACAPDVQVPTAEWKVVRLGGIPHKGRRWLQKAEQPTLPPI